MTTTTPQTRPPMTRPGQALAKQDPANAMNALMQRCKPQIMAALPKHLSPDRMARICLTEVRKNPELALCDQMSFIGAVIQCAQLGLEPGSGLGHAYLIPFNNRKKGIKEVQFIPGYRGLIDLARRSGQIETISARIVREHDAFRYQYGDDERIEHMPFEGTEEQAGRITHVYAIARMKGGGIQREVMTRAQIDAVKDNGNRNPVWDSHFDEMARKTVVRRICKYLPLSPELATALEREDQSLKGEGQENWGVIDASYEPKVAHDPEKTAQIQAEGSADRFQSEPARAADKKAALRQFEAAVAGVRKVGGDPEKILGLKINDVLLAEAATIEAKADI